MNEAAIGQQVRHGLWCRLHRVHGSLLFSVFVVLAIPAAQPSGVAAQSRQTANTIKLDEGASPGKGSLSDAAWLVGRWQGPAMGAVAEEVWLPAAGGALLGMFRLARPDAAQFYELFTLREDNGSLTIQLKHFNPDMKGWEEKDRTVDFRLVRVEQDVLYFEGLTYRQISPDEYHAFVVVQQNDGTRDEISFQFRRVK